MLLKLKRWLYECCNLSLSSVDFQSPYELKIKANIYEVFDKIT